MEKNSRIRIILTLFFVILITSNFVLLSNYYFVDGSQPGVRKNWSYSTLYRIDQQPIISSIDYDSSPEILFTTYNKLVCLSEDGTINWEKTDSIIYSYPRYVSAYDIAYDSSKEVLLSSVDRLLVYDYDGLYRWGYILNGIITTKAVSADLDNDLSKEVLFGTDEGEIYCLNCFGDHLWNISLGGKIFSDIVFTDFENDNQLEILVGGGYNNHAMHCLNSNGTLRWEYSTFGEVEHPVLADLNNDSIDEIIFASRNGLVTCINSNGNPIWEYETLWIPKTPSFYDINGDGDLEVLFFINYPLSKGELVCLTNNGSQLWKIDNIDVSNGYPIINDIDDNKIPDIIYSSSEGLVCRLNTTKIQFIFRGAYSLSNLLEPIVYDFKNDSKLDILYTSYIEIFSLEVYNKSLFYGAYMLPIYVISIAIIVSSILIIYRGFKTGKITIKPKRKIYSYTNEDGSKIYFEKET